MKVALVNPFDVKDIKIWSGIPFYLSIFLESIFGKDNITFISIPLKRNTLSYIKGFYFNRVLKKTYLSDFDAAVVSANYKTFEGIRNGGYDLIITFQFFIIPNLKNEKSKIIFWSDATFDNLLNFYGYVSNLPSLETKRIHQLQKDALEISDQVILSSQWAIDSAVNKYQTAKKKLKLIPFTSNLSSFPDFDELYNIVESRSRDIVRLLFIGVDWKRKGGDEAVEVLNGLNNRGMKAILYVIGTDVPLKYKENENILPLGFINKTLADGEKKLIRLLRECTFLILPTKADCTPVVFSEAGSYGLPVITTNVGGITSIVINNTNGHYFEPKDFVEKAIAFIENNQNASQGYGTLCINSYKHYRDVLSLNTLEKNFKLTVNELFYPQQPFK